MLLRSGDRCRFRIDLVREAYLSALGGAPEPLSHFSSPDPKFKRCCQSRCPAAGSQQNGAPV